MSACWCVWSGGKTEVGVCVLARVEWRENGSRCLRVGACGVEGKRK